MDAFSAADKNRELTPKVGLGIRDEEVSFFLEINIELICISFQSLHEKM